jgi:2-keto-myo-inositol isomerase
MEPYRIGLNLVTLRDGLSGEALPANLDRARRAGFQGVGLWVSAIEQWLASGGTIAQLVEAVHGRGLEVHELCFVPVLDEHGGVSDQRRVFEWAVELQAGAVICIYGKPGNPLDQAADDWREFVETVEQAGVPAAFEFIGPWQHYNSPLEAWHVIREGPDLGTMVFDTFHFWRGGGNLSQIDSVPADRISLVHLNDVNDVPRASAVDADRTYPGEGVMPLGEILGRLRDNGLAGPLSVEIFGQAQKDDPDQVSAHAYESAAAVAEAL